MEATFAVFCLTSALLTQEFIVYAATNQLDLSITVPAECVGEELCLKKPIDYPTETMDRLAKRLMNRRRRQSFPENEVPKSVHHDGNNCVAVEEKIQPYLFMQNYTTHFVIQSQFFEQVIISRSCSTEKSTCFKNLNLPGNRNYTCITKYSAVSLAVYDLHQQKMKTMETSIAVDCACMCEVD